MEDLVGLGGTAGQETLRRDIEVMKKIIANPKETNREDFGEFKKFLARHPG